MKISRNGVFEDSRSVLENLDQLVDENFWIGRSNWSSDPFFEGSVTELRVFGFERTASELAGSAAAFTILITSATQGFVANPGGSRGNLCIVGQIGRLIGPGQFMPASPEGLVPVLPGQTWNFQAWYRDSDAGVATSNFSDALEMTFL